MIEGEPLETSVWVRVDSKNYSIAVNRLTELFTKYNIRNFSNFPPVGFAVNMLSSEQMQEFASTLVAFPQVSKVWITYDGALRDILPFLRDMGNWIDVKVSTCDLSSEEELTRFIEMVKGIPNLKVLRLPYLHHEKMKKLKEDLNDYLVRLIFR